MAAARALRRPLEPPPLRFNQPVSQPSALPGSSARPSTIRCRRRPWRARTRRSAAGCRGRAGSSAPCGGGAHSTATRRRGTRPEGTSRSSHRPTSGGTRGKGRMRVLAALAGRKGAGADVRRARGWRVFRLWSYLTFRRGRSGSASAAVSSSAMAAALNVWQMRQTAGMGCQSRDLGVSAAPTKAPRCTKTMRVYPWIDI